MLPVGDDRRISDEVDVELRSDMRGLSNKNDGNQ